MRKRIIKAGVLAAVFILALVVSSLLINRGTDDKIVDMGAPSLPRISFYVGNTEVVSVMLVGEEEETVELPAPGQVIHLRLNTGRIHLFDPETQKNILI